MARRVSSPVFVGRTQELESLRATLVRASRGEPTVVVVEGDAGIGKSRLVAEFARRAKLEGAFVLAGGALATGLETAPFGPIADALRQRVEEIGSDIVASLAPAARAAIGHLVPTLGGVAERDGAPVPSTPERARLDEMAQGRVLEAILDLLGRLGSRQPVVLVLEDLHWADRSTLAFLAFLSQNLRAERLLVVATVRTDDLVAGQPVAQLLTELTRSGLADRLKLAGLERDATRTLVEAILGHVPNENLVDAVQTRSDGNPFYVEELLGSIPDPATGVTATLREIVASRLARLSEPARRTLRAAAVVATDIDSSQLAGAMGTDETEVEAHLREGLDQHLLAMDGGRLAFRHALVREILYSDLLPGERRAMHSRMARALETSGLRDAKTVAALARHWDAGGDPERAFGAHLAAADAARSASAPSDEQRYLERALELATVVEPSVREGIDLVALRRQAAEVSIAAGDFHRAVVLARSALAGLSADADVRTRGDHLRLLGQALLESGDGEEARRSIEEAVAVLSGIPSIELARALALLARMAMLGGAPEGVARAREAKRVAKAVGAAAIEADATDTLGVLIRLYGDPAKSVHPLREALHIATAANDLYGILRAQNNLSTALDEVEGRTAEAIELARDGLATAERAGLQRTWGSILATTVSEQAYRLGEWDTVEAIAGPAILPALRGGFLVGPLFHLARVRLARGDADDAARWLAHLRTVGVGSLYVLNQGVWWVVMAGVERLRGRDDAAMDAVLEGLRVMEGTSVVWPTAELTAIGLRLERDGTTGMRQGDLERAASLIERARTVADRSRHPTGLPPMATAWLAINEAEWMTIRSEPSPSHWATAVDLWHRLGWVYEEARARMGEAEALLYARRPRAEAARTLGAALPIALRLRARPLSEAIERLAHRAGIDLAAGPSVVVSADGPVETPSGAELQLSGRELEVLRLVAAGRTNGEIGRELFVTTKTASSHVAHILDKLGVSSRTEAAVVAERLGLLAEEARGGDSPPGGPTSIVGATMHVPGRRVRVGRQ